MTQGDDQKGLEGGHEVGHDAGNEAAHHLALIRQVIARSKAERARSGDIYLVWGVIIVVADALTIAGELAGWPWGWIAFPLGTPIGMIYSAIAGRRQQQSWSTFGARVEAQMWFFATLAMIALSFGGFATQILDLRAIVPVVCAVVGVAIGTSGALFESRMMTAAGAVFVAVAGAAFFVSLVGQHLLFMGAIFVGYIVPAIVMLRQERERTSGSL